MTIYHDKPMDSGLIEIKDSSQEMQFLTMVNFKLLSQTLDLLMLPKIEKLYERIRDYGLDYQLSVIRPDDPQSQHESNHYFQ